MISSTKIKKATIWSFIETLTSTVLGIISILFIARILEPSDYGQIAIAQLIAGLVQLIFSLGLSEAIIQKKELSDKDIQVAWLGSLFLSILCGLFCIFVAIYFYLTNNQTLSYILCFEAVNSTLFLVSIVPIALLMRNLEMKLFAYGVIISRVVFFISAIPLVLLHFGLWSIVYSNLIQACIYTSFILFSSRHLIPKEVFFEREKFIQLISFGFFVMLESLLWSVVSRVFGLLIAMFHGVNELGLYNMAMKLIDTILNILNNSIIRLTLPIFSSVQHNKNQLLHAFQASTYYFNLISMPTFFSMALTSDYWIPLILGTKWLAISPIVKIIAVMYGIMYSRVFVAVVVKSLGRTKDFFFLSFISAFITVCAALFTRNMDLTTTLLALAIPRVVITYPLGAMLIKRICNFTVFSQLRPLVIPVLTSLAVLISVIAIQQLNLTNSLMSFLIQFLVGLLIFLIVVFILYNLDRLKYSNSNK